MSNKAMNWSKEVAFLIVFFIQPIHPLQYSFPFTFSVTPDCKCPFLVDAVCGRSGPVQYTYMNKCVLDCTKHAELLYYGACCQENICNPFLSPVCDHNGKMHDSPCAFDHAQCIELRMNGRHLSMDSTQPRCSCVKPCEIAWDPVCDNKGRTHPNRCIFENSKCHHNSEFNETLTVDYPGTCCDDMCIPGHSSEAVCDSEGNTHSDLCSFYKAQCQTVRRSLGKKKLRVSALGPCNQLPINIRDTFHYFIQRFPTK